MPFPRDYFFPSLILLLSWFQLDILQFAILLFLLLFLFYFLIAILLFLFWRRRKIVIIGYSGITFPSKFGLEQQIMDHPFFLSLLQYRSSLCSASVFEAVSKQPWTECQSVASPSHSLAPRFI